MIITKLYQSVDIDLIKYLPSQCAPCTDGMYAIAFSLIIKNELVHTNFEPAFIFSENICDFSRSVVHLRLEIFDSNK